MLTLHTLQSPAAYEQLRTRGRLVADPSLAEPEFVEAYGWMRRQMDERIGPGTGIVWLWAGVGYRELAALCRGCRGEVLLTVRMHRRDVLLSDFGDWHSVLNRSLAIPPLPHETWEAWEERFERTYEEWWRRVQPHADAPLSTWPPPLRAELEASWTAVFEVSSDGRDGAGGVQATTTVVRVEDVVRATRIC
ncbi:DUF3841 domain-containing protein [Nocardioides rotundus]|uniref:DUF3841 domain-containing protein n=1 Tax=Nocardioides rotundus TaxID=1774216 RepID=UPI001CBDED18|nr:DUF3841 domain-containing protein [Nocardioides rotundus]UAL31136.1 DUF3841 domain-containing protein [Nocardioides rotundus]